MIKKIIFCVAILFAFNSDAASAPFSTAPAPDQAYHSTSSSSSVAVSQPALQNSAPVSSTINTAGITLNTSAQSVSSQNPKTRAEIQNLVESNQAIGVAIQSIDTNIAILQRAIDQLQLQQVHPQPAPFSYSNIFHSVFSDIKTPIGLSITGFIILALGLSIGHFLIRRSEDRAFIAGTAAQTRHARRLDPLADEDTRNEYDFMATREAIPAKLDLARSYMAMNDHDQAYGILKTVMEKGNDDERMEAQLLIQKIVKKK